MFINTVCGSTSGGYIYECYKNINHKPEERENNSVLDDKGSFKLVFL